MYQQWRSCLLLITLALSLMLGILPATAQCDPSDPLCVPTETPAGSCETVQPDPSYDYTECNGVITNSGESGEHALVLNPDETLVNNGQILATDQGGGDAVHHYYDPALQSQPEGPAGVVITNNTSAVISSQSGDGLESSNHLYVENSGTIAGGDHGIEAEGQYFELQNRSGGVIQGGNDAIAVSGGAEIAIQEGSTVESINGDAIDIESENGAVANNGTITSQSGSGIEAPDQVNVSNHTDGNTPATINGYCYGVKAGDDANITNTGVISSEHCSAITGGEGTYVLNNLRNDENPSIIVSEESMGIEVESASLVQNGVNGEIRGECHAVRGYYTGEVANNSIGGDSLAVINRGLIQSESCDGVAAEETLYVRVEAGSIIGGDGGDGIDMDHGEVEIQSDGMIAGGDDGIEIDGTLSGETLIHNQGTIEGEHIGVNAHVDGNSDSQTVINEGRITGESGTAVHLGDGNDFFEAIFGSFADGVVNGGEDTDTLRIRYDENGASEEERSQAAQATSNASTQNCPCTVSFTMFGISFNYTYTNFEKVEVYRNGSDEPQTVNQASGAAEETQALTISEPIAETPVVEADRLPAAEEAVPDIQSPLAELEVVHPSVTEAMMVQPTVTDSSIPMVSTPDIRLTSVFNLILDKLASWGF